MHNSSKSSFSGKDSWTILSPIEQSIKEKIEAVGTPLKDWDISINRGILTGYNDAFIITGKKKDELIAQDSKSAEIIRPILRGKDIKRYKVEFADLWLICTHNGNKKNGEPPVNIEQFPAIKDHLDQFYDKLSARADKGDTPYNLRNCVYMDDFYKQKIVWGNLCLSAQFAFAEEGYFINAPSPMIVPGNKFILAVLNSKLGDWYIRQLGVTRNGGYFEYKPMFVQQLPVPQIIESEQTKFISLVDDIITAQNGKDTSRIEQTIDEMVYKLYGLSNEEKAFVNGTK